MTLTRFAVPLLAATLALTACEAGEAPATDDAEREEAGAVDSVEALAPTPGALTPINRSGIRGRAEVTPEGDGFLLLVEAEGLEPGTRYTAHLHDGRCADGGAIRLPLGRVMATDQGTGSIRMQVDADRIPVEEELFVQIHGPDDRPVACANLDAGNGGS